MNQKLIPPPKPKIPKIGIDIGRVIFDDDAELDINGRYPELPGAIDCIAVLSKHIFGPPNTYLVSKSGKRTASEALNLLNQHDFFNRTGILVDNVYFVVARYEKASVAWNLGIEYFIDDRAEVQYYLKARNIDNLYLFNVDQDELNRWSMVEPYVKKFTRWPEMGAEVIADVSKARSSS